MKRGLLLTGFSLALTAGAWADKPPKPAVVPSEFQWVRTLDAEGYVQSENQRGTGIQHAQLNLHYLDPDVNAYIGMQTYFDRFNRDIALGDPNDPALGDFLWSLGANIGLQSKRHRWELDLMGIAMRDHIGPSLGLVSEHQISQRWSYANRLQLSILVNDFIFDFDQELYWRLGNVWGVTAGYRWFTAMHIDRSGPHIGLRYRFDSPKVPFIFPSLG
jgi:hypothetical protein